MAPNYSTYPTYFGISISLIPLNKHKYKTKTLSYIFLFPPLNLNFIASCPKTSTYRKIHCLQARCVTSVFPPPKELDLLINLYVLFYKKFLALILSKCSTNSFTFIMSLAAIQVVSFSLFPHHLTKYFFFNFTIFVWNSYTWGCCLPHIWNNLLQGRNMA